jgi:hypothetical protein
MELGVGEFNSPAVRPHPWIDDGEHDAGRKVLDGPHEGQAASSNVVGGDFVTDVDDGDMGSDPPDH